MKQLFIIDGHFFLYRARHAYPPMSNRDGLSSNMIYGFWRMIIHLLALKPDNIIIVRDAPGRVHREDLLPSYKANRATMPDDFRQQTTLCKSLCVQLGIHSLEKSGYEADDIIYTLAKHRRNNNSLGEDRTYVIYSADKDLKQILEFDNILIRDPIKENERTKQTFQRSFGFDPLQIIDYLSLVGDSSDNIPGARGIGPKGASELIKTYGTLGGIYDNLNNLTDKLKETLLTCKNDIERAYTLISLVDVPDINIDLSAPFKPDIVHRKEIFVKQYHFHSFDKILDELKKQRYFSSDGGLFG